MLQKFSLNALDKDFLPFVFLEFRVDSPFIIIIIRSFPYKKSKM